MNSSIAKRLGYDTGKPPIDPWEMSENRYNVLVTVTLRTKRMFLKRIRRKQRKRRSSKKDAKKKVKRCSSNGCNKKLSNKYPQICSRCTGLGLGSNSTKIENQANEHFLKDLEIKLKREKEDYLSSVGRGNGKLPYPCKFFAIGQCRYRDACRFSHAQPGATGFGGINSAGGHGHGQTYRGSIWSHPDVIAGMKSMRASKPSWDWNR